MAIEVPPIDGHEATFAVRRAEREATVTLASGHRMVWLATGAETSGAFALQEWLPPPGLPWVPPHRHREDDEGFYILGGVLEFVVDGRRFTAEAGTWVFIPRGVIHTWRNPGDTPARFLTLLAPARFGGWFESERTPAVNEEFGIEFIGASPPAPRRS